MSRGGQIRMFFPVHIQRVADGEFREDFGGVVGRRPLAVAAREAEDEVAFSVADAALLTVRPFILEEHIIREFVGTVDWDHPRAVIWVAIVVDLEELLGGEEALVRHQTLVHSTKLIDTQRCVGEGLALPPRFSLVKQDSR